MVLELSWALDRYCDLALKLMSLELSFDDCNLVSWALERYCDLALKLLSWGLQLAPHHPHSCRDQDLPRELFPTFSDLRAAELEEGVWSLGAFAWAWASLWQFSARALGRFSLWARPWPLGRFSPWRLSRRNAWPYCPFKGIYRWPCSPFMAFLGPPPGLSGNLPQKWVGKNTSPGDVFLTAREKTFLSITAFNRTSRLCCSLFWAQT